MFSVHRGFRIAVTIVGVLNLFWFAAATFAICFRCTPVEKAWQPHKNGTCIDFMAFVGGIELPNSLLDFAIMGLPVKIIRGLQIPIRAKVWLGFILALGGL